MCNEKVVKYLTEKGTIYYPDLFVGDMIEFDHFGTLRKGIIRTIDVHLEKKQKLINNDPIYLEDLQWVNPDKVGWSDDRWRP